MWWGGFSELISRSKKRVSWKVLIPMWWGGFSENRHISAFKAFIDVLIPMWWGGFSELRQDGYKVLADFSLNPHVVGRFFRERRGVFFIKFKCLKWPISKLQIFTKINGG